MAKAAPLRDAFFMAGYRAIRHHDPRRPSTQLHPPSQCSVACLTAVWKASSGSLRARQSGQFQSSQGFIVATERQRSRTETDRSQPRHAQGRATPPGHTTHRSPHYWSMFFRSIVQALSVHSLHDAP
jgi:hypothetical protein